ncbi:prolipoprotein diacylglyceryl transferase [Pseudonocardia sp. MH-G8]|uniref:prolipoprotein diacylglyceryl transferase n=1 Tax=Pseudonocardia sp. MH-G8 TaxID=1854588 RepID=UPI0018E9C5D9|nr:prolipoprotein diacylglyceryl transferase family protein [Pseudonocardia sp. MH-G8]
MLHGTLWRFLGPKLYYLAEHAPTLTWHDFDPMGFTWYGGLIAGTAAVLVVIQRNQLPLSLVSGLIAVPLSLAYGIGRLGCLLAGDGTYGCPTDLLWATAFPHGSVATMVPVHPTPVYEALAAFAIAGLLAWVGPRVAAPALFGLYLILSGAARFLVEFLRINEPALLGLTQPQLWSALIVIIGIATLARQRRSRAIAPPEAAPATEVVHEP